MILNDVEIRKLCTPPYWHGVDRCNLSMVEPFLEAVSGNGIVSYGLTHAGYDLRLADEVLMFDPKCGEVINPKRFKDDVYRSKVLKRLPVESDARDVSGTAVGRWVTLPPWGYALGMTLEYLRIPRHLKGRCVGKSTLARSALVVNTTPAEPGWHGTLTLELFNPTQLPLVMFIGEGVCQMEFEMLCDTPEVDYLQKGGQYNGQTEVTPARVMT